MKLWALVGMFLVSTGALGAGSWQTGKFESGAGSRDYKLWLPDGYDKTKPLPLVVALHGCQQTAEAFSTQTGLNDLADARKLIVLYPLQSDSANPIGCWNWMLAVNQSRMGGEPEIIAGMTEQVLKTHAVDKSRVYVTGLSAGGAMAANMMACYPDTYAAGAIQGGVMFRMADDPTTGIPAMFDIAKANSPETTGQQAWQCSGKFRGPIPVMIWHGAADSIVIPAHADHILRQFARMNDLADDGEENNSIHLKNPETQVIKTEKRRDYTQSMFRGFGQELLVKNMVEGMDHAWSGGNVQIPYSDPSGPDSTRILIDWLLTKKR